MLPIGEMINVNNQLKWKYWKEPRKIRKETGKVGEFQHRSKFTSVTGRKHWNITFQ